MENQETRESNQPTDQPISQSSSSLSSVPQSNHNMMRWLRILAGVLIIAIPIGVGGFMLGQKNQPAQNEVQKPPAEVASPTDETANWKTYASQEGNYSVKYSDNVKIYLNEKGSVDGVRIPVKDTTVFSEVINQSKTGYQLSIKHQLTNETNLGDFVDKNSSCMEIQSSKARPFILNGKGASIFQDTPCGPYGVTAIYALNNGMGYIIEIETTASYGDISKYADQILSTFKFTN